MDIDTARTNVTELFELVGLKPPFDVSMADRDTVEVVVKYNQVDGLIADEVAHQFARHECCQVKVINLGPEEAKEPHVLCS